MRVSLKWLRELVDFDLSPEDLGHRLTMAGLEGTAIHRIGGSWENVVVAHVLKLERHPNADRLRLATVDLGRGEQLTVVCGAPNIAEGQKVPLARVGASVIDSETGKTETLKAARIRGIVSQGMVCSEVELGLGTDHTGIIVLPVDAPAGQSLNDYLGDVVLDIEVTPNRPDWLSMIGIAWEVAALTGGKVRMPDVSYPESGQPIASLNTVEVQAPDLAPRYTASLITGLTVAPSPGWMQLRLQAAGVRPISNVVDITNYVMLELGQPLHSFDYDSLRGKRVIVRRARPGEKLTTLDGRTHELTTEDLVIADTERAVGFAGVMGGEVSEVSNATRSVLLESATFSQPAIRRTVQRHRIEVGNKRGTEASQRFEKGLPLDLAPVALRRATKLLVELCGGTAAPGIFDAYANPQPPRRVRLTTARLNRVLGIDPGPEKVSSTLRSLGFDVTPISAAASQPPHRPSPSVRPELVEGRTNEAVEVTVPFWRNDVSIPDDVAEEVARVIGYDSIPTTLPKGGLPDYQPQPLRDLKETAKDVLVGLGMQEVINYALVGKDLLDRTAPAGTPEPLRVWNPMSAQQEYLRTTLRGGLLRTFAANERSAEGGLRLFEAGRVYLENPAVKASGRSVADLRTLPPVLERDHIVGVLGGLRVGQSWHGEGQPMDFFDAKGVLEALFDRLGIPADFEAAEDRILAAGRTARVLVAGQPFGLVGEVHPDVLSALDIRTPIVVLFEIDLAAALPHRRRLHDYKPISRYPGVLRDLALVLDASIPSGRVEKIIRDFPAIASVALVDVYTGEQVGPGKKSLAFRITWQSPVRTLTDREVEVAQAQLLEALDREAGAKLRG